MPTSSSAAAPSGAAGYVVALVPEDHFEQLAHFRIVLDDQDRAGVAGRLPRVGFRLEAAVRARLRRRRAGASMHVDAKTRALAGRERTRTG